MNLPPPDDILDMLAKHAADLFTDAENRLLTTLHQHATRYDLDDNLNRAALIDELTNQARNLVHAIPPNLATQIAQIAYNTGAASILTELAPLPRTPYGAPIGQANLYAALQTAADLTTRYNDVKNRILRFPNDVYANLQAEEVTARLLTQTDYADAQHDAITRWYEKGIPAFTDQAGRTWRTGTYIEMATRTGAQRAHTEGRAQQLLNTGITLAQIQELHDACPKCAPWHGAIITLTPTPTGPQTHTNPITGQPVTINIKATLEQARQTGWQHPNCRGTIHAHIPGTTPPPTTKPNPQATQDRQQLRNTERAIRDTKRALTQNPNNQQLRKQLRQQQQTARNIVAKGNTTRTPWREQLRWTDPQSPGGNA